jgi:hypothetical protein
MWKVLYDTAAFSDAPREHLIPTFRAGNSHNLFGHIERPHYTNVGCYQIPPAAFFRLTEFGLRADLDGPLADDMLRALLRSMTARLLVGERECFAVPPGGFYPPGMTKTVDSFVAGTESNDRDADGVRIKPLVTHDTGQDESAQLWADDLGTPLESIMYYPSAAGAVIDSRTQLTLQLRARGGKVTFEQSNDGKDWCDVTPAVADQTVDAVYAKGHEWFGGELFGGGERLSTFCLFYRCMARFFRVRWHPTGDEWNKIELSVLSRGEGRALNNDLEDPEPSWLRGGFCRFIPCLSGCWPNGGARHHVGE